MILLNRLSLLRPSLKHFGLIIFLFCLVSLTSHSIAETLNVCYKDLTELDMDLSSNANTRLKLENSAYFGATGTVAPESFAFKSLVTVDASSLASNSCDIFIGGGFQGNPAEVTQSISVAEGQAIYTWAAAGNRFVIAGCDNVADGLCSELSRTLVGFGNDTVALNSALAYNPLTCGGAGSVATYGGQASYITPLGSDSVLATHSGTNNNGTAAVVTDDLISPSFMVTADADMFGSSGATDIGASATASSNQGIFILNSFKFAADAIQGRLTQPQCFDSYNDLADLELDIVSISSPAIIGSTVNLVVTVENKGPTNVNSVKVAINLPAGLSYNSQSGDGTFDGTDTWTIGSLNNAATATLTLTLNVISAGTHTVSSEITNSSHADSDSLTNSSFLTDDREDGIADDDEDSLSITVAHDYGDAPASYGDAAHGVPTSPSVYLGTTAPDVESSTQLGSDAGYSATGDDSNGTDDEDGITDNPLVTTDFPILLEGATSYSLDVSCTGAGVVAAWVDFDIDDSFETSERNTNHPVTCASGTATLTWSGLSGLVSGQSYIRVRTASLASELANATGNANDGEVEDYAITIANQTIDYATPNACVARGGSTTGTNLFTLFDNGTFGFENGLTNQSPAVNPYTGIITGGTYIQFAGGRPDHGEYSFVANAVFERNSSQHPHIIDPIYGMKGRFFASDPNDSTPQMSFTLTGLTPYEFYEYSFWAANSEHSGAPNNIDVIVNGTTVYSTGDLPAVNAALEWKKHSVTFTNGSSTTADIVLKSTKTGAGGNDFYLDNIELLACNLIRDFGDAPASFNDAIHAGPLTPSVYLGTAIPDDENETQLGSDAGASATGDDSTGTDDEDGISFNTMLLNDATSFTIPAEDITVTNNSGAAATLHAWIDFNNNGAFDPAEYASASVPNGTTTNEPASDLSWTGLTNLNNGVTYARFRLTTTSLSDDGGLTTSYDDRSVATVTDGEVEDYSLSIMTSISGTVFKDEDSNDSLNGSDAGVAAISVKLYQDTNSNSLFEPLSDTLIDSTVTLSGGSFSLGTSTNATYFVVIDHLDSDLPAAYLPDRTVRSVSFSGSSISGQDFPLDPTTTSLETCSVSAYLFQNNPSDVYGVNLATGTSNLLASAIGNRHINAIGFNSLDNFVYGSNNTDRNGTISKVDGNFDVFTLGPIVGLPLTSFITGDMSDDGKLHFYDAGKIRIINLDPSSATYLQLTTVTMSQTLTISDWAFNPIDDMLYVATNNTPKLYRVNPSTGVVEDLGNTGITGTIGFGAQFYDADGFLYLSNNSNGYIYRIDTRNPASIDPTATFFSNGPTSSTNDGARCMFAPVLNDFGDAPSSYKTLLTDGGAKHDISLGTTVYLGSVAPDDEIDGQPSTLADGDDSDEDGVSFNASPLNGQTLSYEANSSFEVTTTGDAYLQAWIDWDANGTFDTDEQIAKNLRPVAGKIIIPFGLPEDAVSGATYARFRYSSQPDLDAFGSASDGEVEDYTINLETAAIRGTIFYDDGQAGGTAHNGIQDGAEQGVAGVTVTATDGANLVTTKTDGSGAYYLSIPSSFGASITVSHNALLPTGSSIAGTTVSACLASAFNDALAASKLVGDANCSAAIDGAETGFSNTLHDAYDFGVVPESSLRPDQNAQAGSPDTVIYTHLYTPGTLGFVALSLTGGRYNYQVFLDADCDGEIQNAEQTDVLVSGFNVTNSWVRDNDGRLAACALELRVIIPAGEPDGRLDIVSLEADLSWQNAASISDANTITDITTINNGAKLKVTKQVRNLSDGGSFAIRTEGAPGDTLEYCISYTNIGIESLQSTVMTDPLPYFTSFLSDAYDSGSGDQSIQWNAGSTSLLTEASDSDEAEFRNQFVQLDIGTVNAGEAGSLCYQVTID